MSQFAPPHEPAGAAGEHPETMTPPVIEAALAEFRAWLQEILASGACQRPVSDQGIETARSPEQPLDLHTLLSQFVALRHEVNLQTKASRAQQEHNAETLSILERALEQLEEGETAPASDENTRPLLKTLVELHDSLSLAHREVAKTQATLEPLLKILSTGDKAEVNGQAATEDSRQRSRPSWWARWFRGASNQETAKLQAWQAQARTAVQQVERIVSSLITGYTMSQRRVERVLQQFGMEAIPTIGLPFDPETMEALEVVHEAGRAETEVIEEVRRGYLWRGQPFRCAQVRVARPLSS